MGREAAVESHFARMKADLSHMKSKGQEGSKRMLSMLLGSQGELMLKASFTAWHELSFVLKMERENEKMKAGLRAKGSESNKRMLAMLMGSQAEVLRKAAFAGWWEFVAEVKREQAAQAARDLKAKSAESSNRMLGMLLGGKSDMLKKASFAGWHDTAMREMFMKFRKERAKMRAKAQESQRRMVALLMGSQGSMLLKRTFSAWADLAKASKEQKLLRKLRSKGDESTKRMLGMLMHSQVEVLMKNVFNSWREVAVAEHFARMKANLSHMKEKGQEGSRRMLGMLMGSQSELLEKASFTAWHELTSTLKQQREIEQLRSGMKQKGAESTKRMLAMLMGAQEEVVKKAAFAGWRDHVLEVKNEHALSRMQQDLRARNGESSKRMLGMLMGSQAEVLKKAAFAGWWDYVSAEKIARIKDENSRARSKEDESRRRMLAMLMGSQSALMLKASFSGWQELLSVMKQQREIERVKSQMNSRKDASSKRMLSMLMGSQAEVLIKASFSGWWELVSQAKQERHLAELRTNMSSKNAESSKRMLGMLLGARSEALVKLCFGGWKDVAGEAKTARIRQDNLKIRNKEDVSRRRMLGMLVGSQGNLMKNGVLWMARIDCDA